MHMTIYHGSDHIVSTPKFGFGKQDNDYGSGFYTTENYQRAAEWALNNGGNDNIVNKYFINVDDLKIIHLDQFGPLAWISEIAANRGTRGEAASMRAELLLPKYRIDISEADIVIGYRADDSYSDIVDAFFNNQLNIDEVDRLFRKGNLGEQVFIKSEKAFQSLTFIGYDRVNEKDYSNEDEFIARSDVAKFLRNRANQMIVNNYHPNGITVEEAIQHYFVYDKEYQYYKEVESNHDLQTEGEYADD